MSQSSLPTHPQEGQTPPQLRILHVESVHNAQERSVELESFAASLGKGKIYTFTVVEDLFQCLEQIGIKYYDVIVLHDQTPGLPVYDAMKKIKTGHPTTPVMFISQPSSEPLNFILAKCRQVGFTNVLRCPYTLDDYFFAVNSMSLMASKDVLHSQDPIAKNPSAPPMSSPPTSFQKLHRPLSDHNYGFVMSARPELFSVPPHPQFYQPMPHPILYPFHPSQSYLYAAQYLNYSFPPPIPGYQPFGYLHQHQRGKQDQYCKLPDGSEIGTPERDI